MLVCLCVCAWAHIATQLTLLAPVVRAMNVNSQFYDNHGGFGFWDCFDCESAPVAQQAFSILGILAVVAALLLGQEQRKNGSQNFTNMGSGCAAFASKTAWPHVCTNMFMQADDNGWWHVFLYSLICCVKVRACVCTSARARIRHMCVCVCVCVCDMHACMYIHVFLSIHVCARVCVHVAC